MLHQMKLYEPAFKKIEAGSKTLELRLYDKKRQAIKLYDEIEFVELPNMDRKIRVRVIGLLVYPTFASIIDDTPTALMGYPETEREYLRTSMYEVYSPDDEAKYGVLGIRFTTEIREFKNPK